ncbi:diguanylate cyclase (GGDEF)-like protein/PAS domain S-box-containing protein [Massilia sp. UYP11]|uniref:diguanylate cyclase domain-containing protein n=1 Tax=Massilia sp. UYP11 TaxID=1756385 RepID=UPI003D210693
MRPHIVAVMRARMRRLGVRAHSVWLWPIGFFATLALSTMLSHSLIDDMRRQQAVTMASARVERELQELLQLTVDVESGTRGFVITRDPAFLEPATLALPRIEAALEHLRSVARDHADVAAAAAIVALKKEVRSRLDEALEIQADAAAGRPIRIEKMRASKQLQDSIRVLVGKVSGDERALRMASTQRATALEVQLKAANATTTLVLGLMGVMWFRARRRLKRTEDSYRHLFANAANGMALVGADGGIVQANASFAAMVGHAEPALAGMALAALEPEGERGGAAEALRALAGGHQDAVRSERRFLRGDGGEVWLRSTMSSVRARANGKAQVLWVAEDVTEQVRNGELLRRSSVLLGNAGRMAAIDGWFLALPSGALQLGGHMQQLLGLDDPAGAGLMDRFPAQSRRKLLVALASCRRQGVPFDVELDFIGASPKVLRVMGQPAAGRHGMSGIEGAVQCITEQRRIQQSLRKSEQRFRAAAQVSNDGIWDWDIAAGMMWRSRSIAALVGRCIEEPDFGLEAWLQLIHPNDRAGVCEAFAPVMEGRQDELSAEYRVRRSDGSYAWIQDNARALRDEHGVIVRIVGGMRDLTERRRIQQALMGMAASVPSGNPQTYFQALLQHLVQALGADGGLIARPVEGMPGRMRTIAIQVDKQELEELEYDLPGTPCAPLAMEDEHIIPDGLAERCPDAPGLPGLRARAYAGRRLAGADGRFLGVAFVLFREPLVENEVLDTVLRVIASRAQAELERLDAVACLQRQAALLDHAREAITVLGLDLVARYWNQGAQALYGVDAELALGREVGHCYQDQDVPRAALAAVLEHGEWRGESVQQCSAGRSLSVDESWTLVRGADGQPDVILRVGSDVSEKRAVEEQIRRLAYYDPLTGLPNRRLLLDRVAQLRLRNARQQRCGALLFIDMDNFKRLNDGHGHDAGDEFLRQAAARLTACVRAEDTVARFGGDEFVILLEGLDPDPAAAARQARAVGTSVVGAFRRPVEIGKIVHQSTASVGVVLVRDGEEPIDQLLRRADQAMYEAKNGGRDALVVAGDAPDPPALDEDLARDLREGRLRLDLRCEVDGGGVPAGAVATLCWPRASAPAVEGHEVFAAAERCGILPELEAWMLGQCGAILARWKGNPAMAHRRLTLALARSQLRDPHFARRLTGMLAAAGVDAGRLALELPAAALGAGTAGANVDALRAVGVRLVLAGFAMDAAALALLRRNIVDGVCLAPQVVHACLGSAVDAALARAMLDLVRSLGLPAIADGVTEPGQQAFLIAAGCGHVRGPLLGILCDDPPAGAGAAPAGMTGTDIATELMP